MIYSENALRRSSKFICATAGLTDTYRPSESASKIGQEPVVFRLFRSHRFSNQLISKLVYTTLCIVSILYSTPIIAQTIGMGVGKKAGAETDTSESWQLFRPEVCSTLGTPISLQETALNGARIVVFDGEDRQFQELISEFRVNVVGARSTRILADGRRTPHYVNLKGRSLCIELPDLEENHCSVPIRCLSNEVDYVLASETGGPYATVTLADPEEETPPVGHDWVTFAGGSFEAEFPSSGQISNANPPGRNMHPRECPVGLGHPDLDEAWAYSWYGSGCKGTETTKAGRIFYLRKDGTTGSFPLAPGSGMELKDGKLNWSFPDEKMNVIVDCNKSDGKFAVSADQITEFDLNIRLTGTLALANKPVAERVLESLLPDAEKICGVAVNGRRVNLNIYSSRALLVFDSYSFNQAGSLSFVSSDTENARFQDSIRHRNLENEFSVRIVSFLERDFRALWDADLNNQINSKVRVPNIANILSHDEMGTLIALSEGRTFPFAWRNLEMQEGVLVSSINWSTSVPNNFYFGKLNGSAWSLWSSKVKIEMPSRNVVATCRVPVSSARRMPRENAFLVEGRLVSYANGRMMFDCSTP